MHDVNLAYLHRAMMLLYRTEITDPILAARRGQAIRSIDAIIVGLGDSAFAPTCDRIEWDAAD